MEIWENNLNIWLEYFNGVIIKAYKELQDRVRVVCIENIRGNKSERIERAIGGRNELYILWKK